MSTRTQMFVIVIQALIRSRRAIGPAALADPDTSLESLASGGEAAGKS
jgi:hypothetical protein